MTDFTSASYWCDRKRILTMPIGGTTYHLTDAYLSVTQGLLRQKNYNILLYHIRSIGCRQGLRQRCVNQGDIIINWMDGSRRTSVIENVKNPSQVKEMLLVLSENAKRSRYDRRDLRRLPHAYADDEDLCDEPEDAQDWY